MTCNALSTSSFFSYTAPSMPVSSTERLYLLSRVMLFTSFFPPGIANVNFIVHDILRLTTAHVDTILEKHSNKDVASVIRSFLDYDPIVFRNTLVIEDHAIFNTNRVTDRHIKHLPTNLKMIGFLNCDVTGITDVRQLCMQIKNNSCWYLTFTDCYLDLNHLDWTKIDKWGLTLSLDNCRDISKMNWKNLKKCKNIVGLVFDGSYLGQTVPWNDLPDSLTYISLQGCSLGDVSWKDFERLKQLRKLILTDSKEPSKVDWRHLPKSLKMVDLSGCSLDKVVVHAGIPLALEELHLAHCDLSKGKWHALLNDQLKILILSRCTNLDQLNWKAVQPLNVTILNIVECNPMVVDWRKFQHLDCLVMSSTHFHLIPKLPHLPSSLTQIRDETGKLRYLRTSNKKKLHLAQPRFN